MVEKRDWQIPHYESIQTHIKERATMVDQKDPRVGCTKEEMKSRIENYLPYLTDNDLKEISIQLYHISKRRQEIQINKESK